MPSSSATRFEGRACSARLMRLFRPAIALAACLPWLFAAAQPAATGSTAPERASMVQDSCDLVRGFQMAARTLDPDSESPEVVLDIGVEHDGSIASVDIVRRNVNSRLANWARREIRNCRFLPRIEAGAPQRSVVRIALQLLPRLITAGGRMSCDFPVYPRQASDDAQQGFAVVRVHFGADSRPARAEIRSTSGHALLDEAAISAAMSCQPMPNAVLQDPVEIRFQFKR